MTSLTSILRYKGTFALNVLALLFLAVCIMASTSCSVFKRKPVTGEEAIFSKGYSYFERGKNRQAAEYFNRLLEQYPRSSYRTRTQILLGETYFRDELYDEAEFLFSHFIQLHPAHKDAELAYFRLGDCNFEQIKGKDRDQSFTTRALEAYERAIRLYPRSPRREEVEERIRFCKTRLVEHEYGIGRYYLKTKRYVSAAERFAFIVEHNAGGELADDALFYLGEAKRKQGQEEAAEQAWRRLIEEYPESKYRADAEKQLR